MHYFVGPDQTEQKKLKNTIPLEQFAAVHEIYCRCFFRKLDTNVRRKQVRLLDHVTDDADQSEQTNVSGHVLGTTIANSSVNQWLPSPQNRLTAGFIPPQKYQTPPCLTVFRWKYQVFSKVQSPAME